MEIKIETLNAAVEYVIDGMYEGQGFEDLATQENICLAEEAERYIDTYLLKFYCPSNPFTGVDEIEEAIGTAYSALVAAVATAILQWLESHAAEEIPAAEVVRALEARWSEVEEWLEGEETFQEAWQRCHRGDWMLFTAASLGVELQPLILAKAACAALVEDMMPKESLRALEVARQFGLGRATREELKAAAVDAAAATADPEFYSAACAAYAAATDNVPAAGYAASDAAIAAYSAAEPAAAAAARKKILSDAADICRDLLTEEVMERVLHRCRTILML